MYHRSCLTQDGNFLFSGTFPGIPLQPEEADALHFVLSSQPWCCTNVYDFPLLLQSSRQTSLLDLLAELDMKALWSSYTSFDKYVFLIVLISASIPILNATGRESSSA